MYSPYEFKVVDGWIVRFEKKTGTEKDKVIGTDIKTICAYMASLDESLWEMRSIHSEMRENLQSKIDKVEEALNN